LSGRYSKFRRILCFGALSARLRLRDIVTTLHHSSALLSRAKELARYRELRNDLSLNEIWPAMRFTVAIIFLVGLSGPAICQTSTPPARARISEQIRIDSFQSHRRADNYGIASFVISNATDQALNSIELTCWIDDDRAHGTKVLVWPSPRSVPAYDRQQFSNVNIGFFGQSLHAECEVTGAE
jgi:hypothetical protein